MKQKRTQTGKRMFKRQEFEHIIARECVGLRQSINSTYKFYAFFCLVVVVSAELSEWKYFLFFLKKHSNLCGVIVNEKMKLEGRKQEKKRDDTAMEFTSKRGVMWFTRIAVNHSAVRSRMFSKMNACIQMLLENSRIF